MTMFLKVLLGFGGLMALLLIVAWIRVYRGSRCPECRHVPGDTYLSMALLPFGVFFGILYLPVIGALLPLLLLLFKPAEIIEMVGLCRDCGAQGVA